MPVSRVFPKKHSRAGEETGFIDQLHYSINFGEHSGKIHTIRANYPYWAERIEKVQRGEAVIELFYWEGKPYNSKQIVFATLDKDSGCGVQMVDFFQEFFDSNWVVGQAEFSDQLLSTIAQNDGLTLDDFKAWFKGYDLSKPMIIIHFTKFRY